MQISNIPLGRVIAINGQKFAKVNNDSDRGSAFLALAKVNILPANTQPTAGCPMSRIIGTMQTWNSCAALAKPTGTNYTNIGCLVDERDGKPYEIRKFADGKCWMVDNLRYGGGSGTTADYCAGKATFRYANSAANAAATATNGFNPSNGSRNNLVGDCRDPRVGGAAPCTAGSTACGYCYNWSATIQNVNGWWGSSFQPTRPTQGICPAGWHIPTSGSTGEFQVLHAAAGSPATGFWQGGAWKGVYSGLCDSPGSLRHQGSRVHYWSDTQISAYLAYILYFTGGGVSSADDGNKYVGLTVRCIKN